MSITVALDINNILDQTESAAQQNHFERWLCCEFFDIARDAIAAKADLPDYSPRIASVTDVLEKELSRINLEFFGTFYDTTTIDDRFIVHLSEDVTLDYDAVRSIPLDKLAECMIDEGYKFPEHIKIIEDDDFETYSKNIRNVVANYLRPKLMAYWKQQAEKGRFESIQEVTVPRR